MDGMIRLYASYKDTLEKSHGIYMSDWDLNYLNTAKCSKMMDLSINIPLEGALDMGW